MPHRPLPSKSPEPHSSAAWSLTIRIPAWASNRRSRHFTPYPNSASGDPHGEEAKGDENESDASYRSPVSDDDEYGGEDSGSGCVAGMRLRGGRKKECERKGKSARLSREKRRLGLVLQMGPEYGDLGAMNRESDEGEDSDTASQHSDDTVETQILDDAAGVLSGAGPRHIILNGGNPVPETVKLCDIAAGILTSICHAAKDCLTSNGYSRHHSSNIHELVKAVIIGHTPSVTRQQLAKTQLAPGSDESLAGLATVCRETDTLESAVQLVGIFAAMEFAVQVQ